MRHLSRGSPTPAPKIPAAPQVDAAGASLRSVRGAVGIAAYLRQAILDGVYLYGEKLPAERQFAAALKSSRTTVREALRILEQRNFISRRVGSGTFVTFLPDTVEDDVAEITNPVELIEVRLAVEPHMTRLATINATAKDIERLGEVLARLEASGADANHFTKWDRQFHQLLADATHNPLMASVYRHVNHVRGHAQWNAMKDKILGAERIAGYNRQHRDIYQAMCTRDADVAVRVITRHLRDARRDLLAT
ncbi:MAG: FadR/GntR family transcriptional regulator [Alphaproteobacteria bacterium]